MWTTDHCELVKESGHSSCHISPTPPSPPLTSDYREIKLSLQASRPAHPHTNVFTDLKYLKKIHQYGTIAISLFLFLSLSLSLCMYIYVYIYIYIYIYVYVYNVISLSLHHSQQVRQICKILYQLEWPVCTRKSTKFIFDI